MKIAEVRKLLDGYTADQLKLVISELYKIIPKQTNLGFPEDP
jgi:hypothetical protein